MILIIVIYNENADKRDGVSMIDASKGYKKGGNKTVYANRTFIRLAMFSTAGQK